jgi:gamma-glutamyltranspeptidase/glutathione hydrolase
LLSLVDLVTTEGRTLSPLETAQAFMAMTRQRDEILADPDAMRIDVAGLLNLDAAQQLAASLSTTTHDTPSRRHRPNGDTVAVTAADTEGWSVSLIQSVYYGFGSLLLDEGTGVIFHNRGACFSLDAHSPNVLAPGKRPLHTLTPVLAERQHERLAVGCMGGEMQPQILFQVLVRLLHGLPAQDAVGAPRWTIGPWDRDDPPNRLTYEANVDPFVLRGLADWQGPHHSIKYGTSEVGHAQAVRISHYHDDSAIDVGTDPRADGLS